jgi:hypothetical protein
MRTGWLIAAAQLEGFRTLFRYPTVPTELLDVSCAGTKTTSKVAVGAGDRCERTIQESQCSAPTRTGLHDLILWIDG